MKERTKNRLAVALWAVTSTVVWVGFPNFMAAVLLFCMVVALFALSVMAVIRLAKRVAMHPVKVTRFHSWN